MLGLNVSFIGLKGREELSCDDAMAATSQKHRSKKSLGQRQLSDAQTLSGWDRWHLPSVQEISFSTTPLAVHVELQKSAEVYLQEADAMRFSFPELVWSRNGKPDNVSLGPRNQQEDWQRFRPICPAIMEAVDQLLRSFADQRVEVTFGDVLDYGPGHLLGWRQDNMDLKRHLFTVVLTLASDGDGRCEWRRIAHDGKDLEELVASTVPSFGNLAIHGLTCNNELAHRVFWDQGRRVALVLFCRSAEAEAVLNKEGTKSCLSMRYWWTKDYESVK